MAAGQSVRQSQGGKTVANLVAQQQLLKQQQVTALKVSTPSAKGSTATFVQVIIVEQSVRHVE